MMMKRPEHLSCKARLRAEIFQPRDEKAQGECYGYLKGRRKEENEALKVVHGDRTRGKGTNETQEVPSQHQETLLFLL